MTNEFGKTIDKTYLSVDKAEERGFIHRDYIAHCLRWSHVCKYLQEKQRYKETDILDIGCGRELPLLKTLYSSRLIPRSYFGIDYGPINNPGAALMNKINPVLMPNQDFLGVDVTSPFNVVVCFEMLEHVEPLHAALTLEKIKNSLTQDGRAFISTPNYNPQVGAAANHVSEISYSMMNFMINRAGLWVENVWGTFASIKDYKGALSLYNLDFVFENLRDYYDVNYLATIFAPLYPQQSRNCLWRLRHVSDAEVELLTETKFILQEPHGSSDKWGPVLEWLEPHVYKGE